MSKTKNVRQKLAEAKKLGMTPSQYSRYLKTGKKSNKVVKKADPKKVNKNLTKSEKGLSPKRLAELQKMRAKRGKGFLTAKTIRDVGTTKAGTAAEQRAVKHGKKIEKETGSAAKGKAAALAMMKKSRSKANKELAARGVDIATIMYGGPLAAYVGRKALQSAFGQQALKTGAGKAIKKGIEKVGDKISGGLSKAGMALLPATAKLAITKFDKAEKARKAAQAARAKIDPPKEAARKRVKAKQESKIRTEAAQKANKATEGRRATRGGSPANLRPGSRKRFGGSRSSTPQSAKGTAAATAAVVTPKVLGKKKKLEEKKKPRKIFRDVTTKKPDPIRYQPDEGEPLGTASEKSTLTTDKKRKSLFDAMLGDPIKTGDFSAKDQIVKNPFTGEDMELKYEYPDDPDDGMKKGGSIKKNMKKKKAKTKVKKRIALRGYGAALRGF